MTGRLPLATPEDPENGARITSVDATGTVTAARAVLCMSMSCAVLSDVPWCRGCFAVLCCTVL